MTKIVIDKQKIINYVDLFCGLGAFHKAFELNNSEYIKYNCVFACDIDNGIQKLYKENYNIEPRGDITKINIDAMPDFDILCAGFPCQPFSNAGSRKGTDDSRGNLYQSTFKFIEALNPFFCLSSLTLSFKTFLKESLNIDFW